MKAVIFAGGQGTRFSEKTQYMPKPMIEIGGRPILWHIMKTYSHYGINDFIICAGYKQYIIKEYFTNYFLHSSDITVDLSDNSIKLHDCRSENWKARKYPVWKLNRYLKRWYDKKYLKETLQDLRRVCEFIRSHPEHGQEG